MGRFLTPLILEELHDVRGLFGRSEWRVSAPLQFESTVLGRQVIVPVGWKTDRASVPRLPLLFLACGDAGNAAAVVHDYLYAWGEETRKVADRVFFEALRSRGLFIRAWLMWLGVRLGGRRAWRNCRKSG